VPSPLKFRRPSPPYRFPPLWLQSLLKFSKDTILVKDSVAFGASFLEVNDPFFRVNEFWGFFPSFFPYQQAGSLSAPSSTSFLASLKQIMDMASSLPFFCDTFPLQSSPPKCVLFPSSRSPCGPLQVSVVGSLALRIVWFSFNTFRSVTPSAPDTWESPMRENPLGLRRQLSPSPLKPPATF